MSEMNDYLAAKSDPDSLWDYETNDYARPAAKRPRLLDLFCGGGGAAMGYHRAGFDVVGVDCKPQPHFPFEFHQADALTFELGGFDAIHASPPCQAYSAAQSIMGREHPELIDPIRERLEASGVPWVIENVPGAPLRDPVTLCGTMFGLGVYRHRRFECSETLATPPHEQHTRPTAAMGRPVRDGQMMTVVGHFSGVARARMAMGIDWMTRDELAESIPPHYTQFVGEQLMSALPARPGVPSL